MVTGQSRQKVHETVSQTIKAGYGDLILSSQLHGKYKSENHRVQSGPGINELLIALDE
jgi:hypothetical protein